MSSKPDVSSLLGTIAVKQKSGELGASPIQKVQPVQEDKELKSKNSLTAKQEHIGSREEDRRPRGGRPSAKRDDIEYLKISPRIPKALHQRIKVQLAQEAFCDADGRTIKTLDELVMFALERISNQMK